jgi:prepilin-type N-terminal cleavage/methylation domain-containing protein
MKDFGRLVKSERGHNLLELMVVLAIVGVLAGMAVMQLGTSRDSARADGAMRVLLSQLNQAREMAITQRRYIRVTFDVANTQISVVREDTTTTTTTLSSVPFEGGMKFVLVSGVPDTPDHFNASLTAPTSFTSSGGTFPSASGATEVAKFTPDGTLIDWNGRTANLSVFVALSNTNNRSVRAVTVLGATGRVRAYGWNGVVWKAV